MHGTAREPARAANLLAIDGVAAVHQLDVTDPDSVRALAQALDRQPIDLLLHHAASRVPRDAYLGDLDYAGWAEVLETNLFGPLRVTEALLANLRAGQRRQVVIITGDTGVAATSDSGGDYVHRSTAAAVRAALHCAGLDVGWEGFTVVALQPAAQRGKQRALGEDELATDLRQTRTVLDGLGTAVNGQLLDSARQGAARVSRWLGTAGRLILVALGRLGALTQIVPRSSAAGVVGRGGTGCPWPRTGSPPGSPSHIRIRSTCSGVSNSGLRPASRATIRSIELLVPNALPQRRHRAGSSSLIMRGLRAAAVKFSLGSSRITFSGQVFWHSPHCTQASSRNRSIGRSGLSMSAPVGQAPTQARHKVQPATSDLQVAERRPGRQRHEVDRGWCLAVQMVECLSHQRALATQRLESTGRHRRKAAPSVEHRFHQLRVILGHEAQPVRPVPQTIEHGRGMPQRRLQAGDLVALARWRQDEDGPGAVGDGGREIFEPELGDLCDGERQYPGGQAPAGGAPWHRSTRRHAGPRAPAAPDRPPPAFR